LNWAIEYRIRNLIHNVGLFSEAKHHEQQTSPIAKALDAFQSDSTNVGDACEQWLNLTRCPELESYHDKLHKRFDQAVTPSHFLANLLHPIYGGNKLKGDHINAAQELLLDRDPDLVPDLLSFMSNNSRISIVRYTKDSCDTKESIRIY